MTNVQSIDFESSIGNTIHGPSFRDINNDIYTVIAANHPENVQITHNSEGFKRTLPPDLLKDVDVLIGHNLTFDLCYVINDPQLKEFILRGGKIWDTQQAEYILTGQQHKFSSLAELQYKYLGQVEKPSRISYLFKKGIGADRIVQKGIKCRRLWNLYNEYCKSDGATPLLIYKAQLARAKATGMLGAVELYNDYVLALIIITTTGIELDVVKCEKTLRDFNLKHIELLQKLQELITPMWDKRLPAFNINSPDHRSMLLFGGKVSVETSQQNGHYKNGNIRYTKVSEDIQIKGFGVSLDLTVPLKKEGFYNTSDAVMKKISAESTNCVLQEYCALLKESAMYKKAAKTYCQAFLDRSVDGKLYPNFNTCLTETGRLSSSNPNLQNVSTRNQFGKILHSLFIAPKGWKAVSIDFSQLEIFVLAWLSGDPLLTEHLLKGIDLHIVRLQYYNQDKTYEELFKLCKIDKDEYWDKQRSFAKTVSYQMAYGAQPPKVSASTGLPLDIVETIFEKEKLTYSKAASLSDRVIESINNSADISKAINISKSASRDAKFLGSVELLPIFDKLGNMRYNKEYLRRVGQWQSPTGRKYTFSDVGRDTKRGVQRSFSFTQPKNYPMQGGAADIQAATTAALIKALVGKSDKIKMINEVHDSKWFLVREDVLEPCLKYLKETIEDVPKIFKERFGINVPFKFPIEIKVGDDFGDMTVFNIEGK